MKLLSLPPHFFAWHFPLGTFDNFQLNYKDHLGNNRLSYTLDPQTEQVKILEENHYYPFGLKHGNYNAIRKDVRYKEQAASKKEVKQVVPEAVKFKYYYQSLSRLDKGKVGKQERQDELGLNWDSFKYRNYDYAIGRFMSVDPLAEKYPYNATYAFQENKMGLGRELEGLELVYGKGVGLEFKKKFAKTVKFMNKKGTSGLMAQLNLKKYGKTILIDNTGKGSYYRPSENALYWDHTAGSKTNEGHLLSPATILNHEIDHALQHKKNPEQFKKDVKSSDPNYDTKEEKRVIEGSEQTTAKKHGEINNDEVTRKDHDGITMDMPDPTSTNNAVERPKELKTIIITIKKKDEK